VQTQATCISKHLKNTKEQLKNIGEMPKGNCIAECMANFTKIYRGGGQMDKDNFKRLFYNSVSGRKEWETVVGAAIDVCISESEFHIFSLISNRIKKDVFIAMSKSAEFQQAANQKKSFEGEILCHPITGYVIGCMNTEMFKRCPNMTQSVECNALKSYASDCHLSFKYTATSTSGGKTESKSEAQVEGQLEAR
jgi:hypothetical protein